MPEIDILPPRKTVHRPLGPIPYDESSNAGNLAILENIFRGQYHLPDSIFQKRLYLVYGDQKTIRRLRTIKRRRRESEMPFDRLQWILPVPALFHLKMNLLYMISKAHFGGQDRDQSSLYDAMNFWGRKRITRTKSEFHALEELVIHSYKARIVAFYWRHMELRSVLGSQQAEDELERALSSLGFSAFIDLLDYISSQYSHSGNVDIAKDSELRSHILFLRDAQTYLLLKYGIKHGDVGLIRRAVDRCIVYFHGSGQSNYANEMLYLQRLLVNSTPELRKAILSNSLVNLQGLSNTWFEIDRLVEFHNGNMKDLFYARRGSTINLEQLFKNYALSSAYITHLAEDIYRVFNISKNSKHTDKSAQKDIIAMAQRLSVASVRFKAGRTVRYPAIDTVAIGALKIASDALPKFNSVDCLLGFSEANVEALAEADNGFDGNIQDFFALEE